MEKNTQHDDQKMAELQKRAKSFLYTIIVGVVCLVIGIVMVLAIGGTVSVDNVYGIVSVALVAISFILFIVGATSKQKVSEAQKDMASKYTKIVLDRMMDQLDVFDQNMHVEKYYMNQDFGFPKHNHRGHCGDYVKGVLRGIPMEFSEFELQNRYVERDGDGDIRETYETIFYGLIIVCKHGLALSNTVAATQYEPYEDEYKTDNKDFNEAFSVSCQNEQDGAQVFTPDYMKTLLELSSERGKRFAVCFLRDGTLLLVIRDMNLFEMGKSTNTGQLVEKIEKEITDFADIAEKLALPAQK